MIWRFSCSFFYDSSQKRKSKVFEFYAVTPRLGMYTQKMQKVIQLRVGKYIKAIYFEFYLTLLLKFKF